MKTRLYPGASTSTVDHCKQLLTDVYEGKNHRGTDIRILEETLQAIKRFAMARERMQQLINDVDQ